MLGAIIGDIAGSAARKEHGAGSAELLPGQAAASAISAHCLAAARALEQSARDGAVDRKAFQEALASGLHAAARAIDAAVALAHLAGLDIELRSAVRAGLGAGAAADALALVDDHQAVLLALHVRARGAHLHRLDPQEAPYLNAGRNADFALPLEA